MTSASMMILFESTDVMYVRMKTAVSYFSKHQTMLSQIRKYGGPALAVVCTTSICVGAIIYSHYAQVREKSDMRAGVERDKERLRLRRMRQKQQQQQHS